MYNFDNLNEVLKLSVVAHVGLIVLCEDQNIIADLNHRSKYLLSVLRRGGHSALKITCVCGDGVGVCVCVCVCSDWTSADIIVYPQQI